MPRFVLLRHELPASDPRRSHFDLMLEADGVLRTWACDELPQLGKVIEAQRLADHRLAYLDYEGPVSGDRGSVTRVAVGEYELVAESPGELRVRLTGGSLCGILTIKSLPGQPERWRISLEDD